MIVHPTNPSEIPQNIEYRPEIEQNPMAIWMDFSSILLDSPRLTQLEKEMFQTIYRMIQETWDEIYVKNQKERETVFAKYLYEKTAKLIFDTFASDSSFFLKFKQKVLESYASFRRGAVGASATLVRDTEDILKYALNSINDVRLEIVNHANACLKSIEDELTGLGSSGIGRVLDPSSPIGRNNTRLSNIIDLNSIEQEEDLNKFESEIFTIQSAFKKDENAPEYRAFIDRIFKYKQENLNSVARIFSSNSQIDAFRRIDEDFNRFKAFNFKTVLWFSKIGEKVSKLGNTTLRSLLFDIQRKKNPHDRKTAEREANRIFSKFPSPVKFISKIPFKNVLNYIVAPLLYMSLMYSDITIKLVKKFSGFTIGFFKKSFGKINSLIEKLENGFFNFISNPMKVFFAGMAIPIISRILVRIFQKDNNKLKTFLNAIGSFIKKITLKVYSIVKDKIKGIWEKWKKSYPFLQSVEDFIKSLKKSWASRFFLNISENILDFFLGKKTGKKDNDGKEIREGGYIEDLRKDKESKYNIWKFNRRKDLKKRGILSDEQIEEELNKKKEISWLEYFINPNYFASKVVTDMSQWFFESNLWTLIQTVVFSVKSLFTIGGKIVKDLGGFLIDSAKWLNKHSVMKNLLLSVVDLFRTKFGQFVQLLGASNIFGLWGLLLVPAFVLGDLIYRSFKDKNGNLLTIEEKYEELYGLKPNEMYERSRKTYENQFRTKNGDDEGKVGDFLYNYDLLYSKVDSEVRNIDSLIKELNYKSQYLKKHKEDNKVENVTFSNPKLRGFVDDVLFSPFFNTYLDEPSKLPKSLEDQIWFLKTSLRKRRDILEKYFLTPLNFNYFSADSIEDLSKSSTRKALGEKIKDNTFEIFYKNTFGQSFSEFGKMHLFSPNIPKKLSLQHKEGNLEGLPKLNTYVEKLMKGSFESIPDEFKPFFRDLGNGKVGLAKGYTLGRFGEIEKIDHAGIIKNLVGSEGFLVRFSEALRNTSSVYLSEKYGISPMERETFLKKLEMNFSIGRIEEALDKHGNIVDALRNIVEETIIESDTDHNFGNPEGTMTPEQTEKRRKYFMDILFKFNNLNPLVVDKDAYENLITSINTLSSMFNNL